jgi:hypothetical protein
MSDKVERSDAERAAFKAGLAAAKKKEGARKRSSSTTDRRRGRKGQGKGKGKKPSGCKQPAKHTTKEGAETTKIFAWRKLPGGGRQLLNAYLSQDGGAPKNGTSQEVCSTFVCNLTTVGVGTTVCSGVWSEKYKKLTVNAPGLTLVANPDGGTGGYFGPGGKALRNKIK